MGNDNQFIEQPPPAFVQPRAAKDGIVALQTPVEPIDSRQTLLNEGKFSSKTPRLSSSVFKSTDKIFAIALFILLVILISFIIFHGRITDIKLSRLINHSDSKSSDLRSILEEMNRTLKSIEHLLIEQTRKPNINLQLTGQDIRELHFNQTVFNEFVRRLKERL